MEDNAPQQTIGRGVLDIQPNIEAVEKAKKDIEQMLDDLKVKARGILEDVQFSGVGQIPAAGSDQATAAMDQASTQRWQEDLLEEMRGIRQLLQEIRDETNPA